MINTLISTTAFLTLLAVFLSGATLSLVFRKQDKIANITGHTLAIIGSALGILFSIFTIASGKDLIFSLVQSSFSLLSVSFHINQLSAFFIFVISLITLFCSVYGMGYAKHFYGKYSLGSLGFFYNLFILGMLLVVTASNGIFFLIAWEIMSIVSYFLVVYDRHNEENVKAGSLYLIMTYVGTAFIIFAFLLLYKYTGSFGFSIIKTNIGSMPLIIKNIVFVLMLVGFGTKAGVIPFHIWLPAAHPAAPSHVSGLMSGVMIKTGIFMMIKLFLDILQPIPLWWGETVIIIGAISALLGVLYALTESDIKKLLAYSSIENIGIILLGLGGAMIFYSLNLPSLALLGLSAALFHTLNHAIFKSLLFLSAGSVINEMHTKNMEEYGGIIKYMPLTALFFLIGSMAISALPPFNGFFSEWLTFQNLFQGIAQTAPSLQWIFILAAGSLTFTGGLALACFVKAFGVIFLARPRSEKIKHIKESSLSMHIGMGALTLCAILFGVFSGFITSIITKIGQSLAIFKDSDSFISVSSGQTIQTLSGFSSVSAPMLFVLLLIALASVWIFFKFIINRKQKIQETITWDCGTTLTPRMEITAAGFARSIMLVFKSVLKPSIQQNIEYKDADSRYLPSTKTVTLSVKDIYSVYLYQPLLKIVNTLSEKSKSIQSGNITTYISYILIALIIILFIVL